LSSPTDRDAWSKLLADATPALRRYAIKLTGGSADADDLIQATFLKAWEHSDQFLYGNAQAWLIVIMRNAHYTLHRNSRRVTSVPSEVLENFSYTLDLDARLTLQDVRAAVEELPLHMREAMRLHLDGFEQAEISEKLGLPMGTTKSRIFRAYWQIVAKLSAKESAPISTPGTE